jgi:hypothetical protein
MSLTINLEPGYTTSIDWSTGWRLPETVDGPWSFGYDGTTTGGYNITSSELGHLYYVALGNLGEYGTNGIRTECFDSIIKNKDPFNNLLMGHDYWSGTEYSGTPDSAWFLHGH